MSGCTKSSFNEPSPPITMTTSAPVSSTIATELSTAAWAMFAFPSAKAARMASEFGAGLTSTWIPNFANVPFISAATTGSGRPGRLVSRIFCRLCALAYAPLAHNNPATRSDRPSHRLAFIETYSLCVRRDLSLRCAFVQFFERPLRDGHRIKDRLSEIRTAQRIKARVRRGPDDVAVPFDEHVVHGAVVASKFFQVAALRRNEVSNLFRLVKVTNIVTTESRDEVRIRNKLLPRFSRRLEMWRIMSAEAAALETKIAVWRFGRGNSAGKLRDGNRVFVIAEVGGPNRQI